MITIRNPNEARARTVVADTALEVGQFVRMIQGAAKGDPVKVRAAVAADLTDVTAVLGIVDFVPDNDLAVDFILNPVNRALSQNTGDDNTYVIPAGSLCVMWHDKPIVGFHSLAVDASLQGAAFTNAREGAAVAMKEGTSKVALYASGDLTVDVVQGIIYQHEGAELTVMFTAF